MNLYNSTCNFSCGLKTILGQLLISAKKYYSLNLESSPIQVTKLICNTDRNHNLWWPWALLITRVWLLCSHLHKWNSVKRWKHQNLVEMKNMHVLAMDREKFAFKYFNLTEVEDHRGHFDGCYLNTNWIVRFMSLSVQQVTINNLIKA